MWLRLSVSDLKREAALREVSIKAVPVNDDDDLDALLSGEILEEKTIADIKNMLIDNLDDVNVLSNEDFLGDWLSESHDINNVETTELISERDRLKQELEALQAQHQFECEYVDQLEHEIISITNDRDHQVKELTIQLEKFQSELSKSLVEPQKTDDRDLSDRLAIHVLQLEEEFKHRLATALEIESQKIAKKHIQAINEKDVLIYQLQSQNAALDISQQSLTNELEASHSLLKESAKTLEIAEAKLLKVTAQRDQIEEELIQHLGNQAKLHQSLRGLENEYVSDLTRVQDSEQQIEELQEQILQQASKTAEYEAAIQHWKEQSVRHQHHALQLSGALERLLDEKPVRHLTQPSTLQVSESKQDVDPRSERSPDGLPETRPVRSPFPSSKVDLPAFLVKHR